MPRREARWRGARTTGEDVGRDEDKRRFLAAICPSLLRLRRCIVERSSFPAASLLSSRGLCDAAPWKCAASYLLNKRDELVVLPSRGTRHRPGSSRDRHGTPRREISWQDALFCAAKCLASERCSLTRVYINDVCFLSAVPVRGCNTSRNNSELLYEGFLARCCTWTGGRRGDKEERWEDRKEGRNA